MSDNPLGDMFGDLFKMLGQQGPDAWYQTATQLALNVAQGDDGDPNPQPVERQRLEEFAPLVGRHVDALFGVSSNHEVTTVNRSGLTMAALVQWKPLIAPMVDTAPSLGLDTDNDEGGAMMAQLAGSFGPLFLGFQMGSVAGHFSERAWSLSALALPREDATRLLVVNNLVAFAQEWSLERDEVYVFALSREFVASLVLSQPGTGDALRALLVDAVRESAAAQGDLLQRLQGMMEPDNMASFMSNPEALLEGIELPGETDATRAINAAAAVLSAFFDAAAEQITTALLGPKPLLSEAWRRHRLSDARGEDAAAALFGIANQGPHHELARTFVAEVAQNHSLSAFSALLRVDGLPSDAELSEPERWFDRVSNSPLA
jgi:uncharacterized protein (DUF2342 family)